MNNMRRGIHEGAYILKAPCSPKDSRPVRILLALITLAFGIGFIVNASRGGFPVGIDLFMLLDYIIFWLVIVAVVRSIHAMIHHKKVLYAQPKDEPVMVPDSRYIADHVRQYVLERDA
jgi:hypothetical protein